MKKLVLFVGLALLLAFSGSAYAESLKLGDKVINYEIPKGYVKADTPIYKMILSVMQRAMPQGLRVQAMYVAEADDAAFKESNGNMGLNDYFVITTLDQLASQKVKAADFKDFKRELKENNGLLEDAKDIVSERLDDVFKGNVQIGGMQSLGCYGETDSQLSYVVIMDQMVNMNGEQIAVKQALIFTGIWVDEKLIFVNQYHIVENETDVLAFKDTAQMVLKNMRFFNEANAASGSKMPVVAVVVAVVIILGVAAGVIIKKKKAQN